MFVSQVSFRKRATYDGDHLRKMNSHDKAISCVFATCSKYSGCLQRMCTVEWRRGIWQFPVESLRPKNPSGFTNRAAQKNCNELCLFRSTETVPLRTEILENFPEILTGSCCDVSSWRRHILERETRRDSCSIWWILMWYAVIGTSTIYTGTVLAYVRVSLSLLLDLVDWGIFGA